MQFKLGICQIDYTNLTLMEVQLIKKCRSMSDYALSKVKSLFEYWVS